MIRARELHGRAVVDMDAAEKLGHIDELVLDPEGRRVAALVVSHGRSVVGGGTHLFVPATAVHAIGPDAVTVRYRSAEADDAQPFAGLPRLADIVGRKVVSESGVLLGRVGDVILAGDDGRILGYALTEHTGATGKLEALFGKDKHDVLRYLRADANLRPGRDLIVAPDGAIATLGAPAVADAHETRPARPRTPEPLMEPVATAGRTSWNTDMSDPRTPSGSAWTWTTRDDLGLKPDEPIR